MVQSIVYCFPELCFLAFSVAQVLVGLREQLINNFVFHTWACAAGFNDNNSNNVNNIPCILCVLHIYSVSLL